MRLPVLVFALFMVLCAPAMAAPAIDEAGAAALKPRMAETVKLFTDALEARGYKVASEGELTVEPAGTYYAVTTPSLSVAMPNGVKRTIGMLAINAIPTDNPDIVKVAVAIPTPIVDSDPNGKPVGRISIANQALSGLWHFGGAAFVQLDARYAGIAAIDNLNGIESKIANLAIGMNLADDGKGKWAGPASVLVKGITHKVQDTAYNIADVSIKSAVTGLDLAARKNLLTAPLTKTEGAEDKSAQDTLAEVISKIADGYDTSVSVSGIGITTPSQDGGTSETQIKSLSLVGKAEGLLGQSPATSWLAALGGVTTNNAAALPFMPTEISFKATSKGVNLGEFFADGDASAMMKEGSISKLDHFIINAPKYGVEARGNFGATTQTTAGGGMFVTLRGLTDLLTWLSGPDAPSMNGNPVPPFITGVLAMVQMMGKPANDAQGRPVLTYDFKYAADGTMSLNGTDFSAIMQGMQKGAGDAMQAAPH